MTWTAAGTLPDVIGAARLVGRGEMYFQWINDGVVRALPDDVSRHPYVERILSQPDVRAFQVEGNNYFLPRANFESTEGWVLERGIVNRRDWRENLGLPVPWIGYLTSSTIFIPRKAKCFWYLDLKAKTGKCKGTK